MLELIQEAIPETLAYLRSHALPALAILVVGLLIIRLSRRFLHKALERSRLEKAGYSLVKSLFTVAVYVALGLVFLASLGVDISGIVTLVSVFSLALSLAVQDILANIFGGMTLLYTHPFKSGDYVEVDGLAGNVIEIGLAYTKLTTVDNRVVSLPNSAVTATQIINYSATGTRRIDVKVRASYVTPPDQVLAALKEAAKLPTVLETPEPQAGVIAYGDSAIEYVLWVWTAASDYWTTTFTVHQNVKTCFDAAGIELTIPRVRVELEK